MSEALNIALTAFFGVCVFVVGQVVSKFLIEPIYEQRKTIGSIADALIFYSRLISSPSHPDTDINNIPALKERSGCEDAIRQLSCSLMARTHGIPLYGFWSRIGFVIKYPAIYESHRHLIFLSHSIERGHSSENKEAVSQLEKLLGFEFDDSVTSIL